MRILIIFYLLVSFDCFGQTDYNYWALEQKVPSWASKVYNDLKLNDSLKFSEFVNPFYFEVDFNGDSNLDIAILIENMKTTEKGILIIHGQTNKFFILGAGNEFNGKMQDFSWLEVWKIYRSSNSHELTYKENGDIDGSKEIKVHNPCLELIKLEASSGLIYWNGKKYCWAQTSD